ncbi:MAG: condensation domain-containing protein [Caldilineaceae bacterium]
MRCHKISCAPILKFYHSPRHGVTVYMLLLATFQLLLHRYTGQDDILVGSPIAGRTRPEFTKVFGYFTSSVAMRADFAGNPTFIQFLQQVRQTVLDALARQDYPFQQIVKQLQPVRTPNVPPIYQATFALQQSQLVYERAGPFSSSSLDEPSIGMKEKLVCENYPLPMFEGQSDLFLELFDNVDGLVGTLKYHSEIFDESTIQRMVLHFQTLLTHIVENPNQYIDRCCKNGAEYHQIVHEWRQHRSDGPREYPCPL